MKKQHISKIRIIILGIIITAILFLTFPEKTEEGLTLTEEPENIINLNPAEVLTYGEEFPIEKLNAIAEPEKQVRVISLNITRQLTDKTGNIQEKMLNTNLQVNQELFAFLSEKDSNIPLDGSTLAITVETKLTPNKNFESRGKYTIFVNNEIYKTETFTVNGNSGNSGNVKLLTTNHKIDDLLAGKPDGIHKIKYIINEFFIIEKYDITEGDDQRFFLSDGTTVYDGEFEIDERKTIIKNENGIFIKVFNSDIKLSVHGNGASYPDSPRCLLKPRAGGCYQWTYDTVKTIPAPLMPYSKLIEKSSGKILAEGTIINTILQRNNAYTLEIGSKTLEIKTPETLTSYHYYCQPIIKTYYSVGVNLHTFYAEGTSCNF